VGIEATGHTRWFERMLGELGAGAVDRRCGADMGGDGAQAEDGRDAAHLLNLLLSGRFPRIWRPSLEERDLRRNL
jgi:transposase